MGSIRAPPVPRGLETGRGYGSVIVTCERCATQFQLDDARIPPGGVRVRCSRCKHAFEIELPSPASPAAVDSAPGETLPDLPPEAPSAEDPWGARDELSVPGAPALADPDEPGPDSDLGAPLSGPEPESASEPQRTLLDDPPEDEESDWEFNDDPPFADSLPEASDHRDASDAVDQFLGSARGSSSGVDATPYAELSAAPSGLDLAGDLGASPESVESSPAGDEPSEAPSGRPAAPDRAEPVGDDAPQADPLAEVAGGSSDELGGPEEWDFFASDSDAEPEPRKPAVRLPPPLTLVEDASAGNRPRWGGWLSRAGSAAGWIAVAAVFAHGVVGALLPDTAAPGLPPVAIAGDLEVVDASGVWIDNVVEGSIYVISGQLRNPGSSPIAPSALAVELLDGEGRIVTGRPVRLEAPHSRRNLRELARAELPGQPPATGRAIAPGASVPFQAVVGPLPPEAHGYRVVEAPASLRKGRPAALPSEPRPAVEPRRERKSERREAIAAGEPSPAAAPVTSPAALAPPR